MDKRYQVFVSSTFLDLKKERQEVMQALLELDCIPAGMELFPATNETQWDTIKKVIDDCDYYILILAGRYGSIAPDGKSYTEKEYDYAIETNKPILTFIHNDLGKIELDKSEKTPEGQEKLGKFIEKARTRLTKGWSTPAELGSVVSRSMVQLIKNEPAIGWVKADLVPDIESTKEILSLKTEIEKLKSKLAIYENIENKQIDELAQGDEQIKIQYTFQTSPNEWGIGDTTIHTKDFSTTWNSIIANILPVCINEASEEQIKTQFNGFIKNCEFDNMKNEVNDKNLHIKNIKINNDSFQTVIIQLRALKIIHNSEKMHSIKDTATYWTLTQKGDEQLVMLRAIKSKTIFDL